MANSKMYVVTEFGPGWDPDEYVLCVTHSSMLATVIRNDATREFNGWGTEPQVYEVPFIDNEDDALAMVERIRSNDHLEGRG